MPSIYKRGRRLYARLKGPNGWFGEPTPYNVGDEEKARRFAKTSQEELDGKAAVHIEQPLTVDRYATRWLRVRREKYEATSKRYQETGLGKVQHRGHRGDESVYRLHIAPYIGSMLMASTHARDLAGWIHTLRTTTALSTKTIRSVYAVASAMFRDATVTGVVESNPCQLKAAELGELEDTAGAGRYTREQFELMIGSSQVPEHGRVYVAIGGLGGLRLGSIAGLRWGDLDATTAPLWRLTSVRTYANRPTKTQRPSVVPVHPVLAEMLAEWRHGWGRMFGRPPTANDPIIPRVPNYWQAEPVPMRKRHAGALMNEVLEALEIPPAPMPSHALRSTFISIALEDGAARDMVKRITHDAGRTRDAFDLYDRANYWPQLCAEVAKVRISPRSGGSVTALATAHATAHGRGRNHMWKYKEAPRPVAGTVVDIGHIRAATMRKGDGEAGRGGTVRPADVASLLQAMSEAALAGDLDRVESLLAEARTATAHGRAAR